MVQCKSLSASSRITLCSTFERDENRSENKEKILNKFFFRCTYSIFNIRIRNSKMSSNWTSESSTDRYIKKMASSLRFVHYQFLQMTSRVCTYLKGTWISDDRNGRKRFKHNVHIRPLNKTSVTSCTFKPVQFTFM